FGAVDFGNHGDDRLRLVAGQQCGATGLVEFQSSRLQVPVEVLAGDAGTYRPAIFGKHGIVVLAHELGQLFPGRCRTAGPAGENGADLSHERRLPLRAPPDHHRGGARQLQCLPSGAEVDDVAVDDDGNIHRLDHSAYWLPARTALIELLPG